MPKSAKKTTAATSVKKKTAYEKQSTLSDAEWLDAIAVLKKHIGNNSETNGKKCVLLKKKGNKGNGHGYPQLGTAQMSANVIAYFSKFKTPKEIRENVRKDFQVSHLCDEPNCVNKDHLVYETPQENNRRKGCTATVTCRGCGHVMECCAHNPKCIGDKPGSCRVCHL